MTVGAEPERGDRERLLLYRLYDAERNHAGARRSACEGASAHALDADHARWARIGREVATLARLIRAECGASQFCDARPDIETLTARLSEAIDDQLDGPSWAMVDAAARLEAARCARYL